MCRFFWGIVLEGVERTGQCWKVGGHGGMSCFAVALMFSIVSNGIMRRCCLGCGYGPS